MAFLTWFVVLIGNLAGAYFVAGLVSVSDDLDLQRKQHLNSIINAKLKSAAEGTARAWMPVVASAALGKWLVGMAAFNSATARTIISKLAALKK